MSKKEKQILLHKKSSRGLPVSARAVHGSLKGGRIVPLPSPAQTRAQVFLQSLKQEIRKAI